MFANLRLAIARHREYSKIVAELSLLSERDLSDLGLNSYDIEGVARQSALEAYPQPEAARGLARRFSI